MITRLALENWRSHENTEFEFSQGTNVLMGAMGSGKTSAIDAICFALFGSFPNLQQRKVRLDDIIKNRPDPEQSASVNLEFTVNGKQYSVLRRIVRGKGTTKNELRESGQLIEGPSSQRVTERICEILKIDYELFSRAVYSEQNGIDYFLEIPKGQRKAKIDELLRISRFENARRNIGTVMSRLRDRRGEKESFAASQREIDGIPGLEKELGKKEAELSDKTQGLKESRSEFSKISGYYEKVMQNKKLFEELDKKIKENAGRLDFLSEKIRGVNVPESRDALETLLEKLAEERKATKRLIEEREKLEKEIEKILGSMQSMRASLSEHEKELRKMKPDEALASEKEGIRKLLDRALSDIENVVSDSKSRKTRLEELHENLGKLKGDKCPVCDADLSDAKRHEIVAHRREEIGRIEKELKELRESEQGFRLSKKELDSQLDEIEKELKYAEKMKWVASEKQKLEKDIAGLEGKQKKAEQELKTRKPERELDDVDKELREVEKKLEHKKMENEHVEITAQQKQLQKELDGLDYDEKLEKNTYDRMKKVEKDVSNLEKDCHYIAEIIEDNKERLSDLNRIREDVERCRREAQYLGETVDSFQTLQKVLQDVQAQLRQTFTDTTNAALSDIWGRIYPYGDYVDLRLGIDAAGDYILQLMRRNGEWINVEGVSSGGERSTACLALRIALSLVLTQNLSWLVLDEPTHNLDREGIRTLASVLKEHLPQLVEQIFLITHEEELESAASGYLYRLERDKEREGATRLMVESSS
jgi:exonuclease SbcC